MQPAPECCVKPFYIRCVDPPATTCSSYYCQDCIQRPYYRTCDDYVSSHAS
ncbi:hypothetical protein MBAV_002551 [Candidatus Magnetobacterium bavaricum]|uniref:Uncharacterized protein n=1 Tax=Candidatus Magnetobacterium bavaricum TaxID=29290 RepID=A0A0F3GX64_9BACT|nr:hypothetical protein MBAV_002551 [Candidatus Magnetobacterium bavaricum]